MNYDNLKVITRHGLSVRSGIERTIAEFLKDNGIVFQYEHTLILDGIEIHPDFYLRDIDVYLEHWGCDDPSYIESRRWKEDMYKKHDIKYISTEKSDVNNIYDKLKMELGKFINKTDWK